MSTFTTNLNIQLIGTGEQAGTWGSTTNNNFQYVFEEAIVGRTTVSFSDANVTLTATAASTDQQYRNVYLNCTGTNAAQRSLIVPTVNKNYIVENNTTGGFAILVTTSGGTGIVVPNGFKAALYVDGTNVVTAFNWLSALTLGSPLLTTSGGTGLSSYTAGDLPYYASGTALSKLGIGTAGYVLTSSGSAPQWTQLSTIGVTTFSAGTTGFTPSSATSGAITLGGTLNVSNGGTGQSSFTANGVVYASSTSALATGSALVFTGTNLGIGTSSPASQLQVSSSGNTPIDITSTGTGAVWTRYNTSTYYFDIGINNSAGTTFSTNAYANVLWGANNYPIVFATNNTEKMRLDSSGNLLINATSNAVQAAKLYVSGTTSTLAMFGDAYSTTVGDSRTILIGNTNAIIGIVESSTNIGIKFQTWSSGASVPLYLSGAGNVGIGTTSPAVKLSVAAGLSSGTANTIRLYDDGSAATSTNSNCYGFGFITNGLTYTAGTSGTHYWYANNAEVMNVNSSSFGIKNPGVVTSYLISTNASNQTNQLVSLYNNGSAYANLALDGAAVAIRNSGTQFAVFTSTQMQFNAGRQIYMEKSGTRSWTQGVDQSSANLVFQSGDGSGTIQMSCGTVNMQALVLGRAYNTAQFYQLGSTSSGTSPTLSLNLRSMGYIQVFYVGSGVERMSMYYFTNCGPTSVYPNISLQSSLGFGVSVSVTAVNNLGGFTVSWSGGSSDGSITVNVVYLGNLYA